MPIFRIISFSLASIILGKIIRDFGPIVLAMTLVGRDICKLWIKLKVHKLRKHLEEKEKGSHQ